MFTPDELASMVRLINLVEDNTKYPLDMAVQNVRRKIVNQHQYDLFDVDRGVMAREDAVVLGAPQPVTFK